uniref:SAM domain-containing protein n=1 Tax=Onchocerca volvulus TaxID=6282 RepID=A0A8R1TS09_ONCVO
MGEIGNQRHVEDGFGTRSLASLRSSTGSAVFKDHRSSIRSTASSSTATSRPLLPYVTHYSDSGFSSTLSSGSSCSFLPPPPPYRGFRGSTKQQHRIHRSLSDSKYGSTTECHLMRLPTGLYAGSVNLQELCRVPRAGSWTSRSPSPSMSTVSCPEYPELQEKLHRLAMARDSLSLQVTILTEQVGAQKEKIRDLENLLATKANNLDSTEELLQERVGSNGDLESKKLDLLAEVSNLKLKYATLEQEKMETERKLQLSQAEIEHLNQTMQSFIMQHGLPPQVYKAQIHAQLPYQQVLGGNIGVETDQATEMVQLRMAVQRLIMDNEQKNIQISSLRNALDEHCRNGREGDICAASMSLPRCYIQNNFEASQPFDINAQLRRLLLDDANEHIAHSSSFPTSLCNAQQRGAVSSRIPSAVQSSSSYTSSLSTASPQHSWSNSGTPRLKTNYDPTITLPPISSRTAARPTPSYHSPSSPAARQLAAELDELRRIGNEMQHKHDAFQNPSFSRSFGRKAASTLTLPRKKLSTTSSGGISAESDDEIMRGVQTRSSIEIGKFRRGKTRSSLKNLFGKLTRSASQEIRSADFQHAGTLRPAHSSRIPIYGPISGAIALRPPLQQFVEWSKEQICEWMAEIGFSVYVPDVERFVRSGRHLLNMTNQEYEKELLIRNPLHRKRLRCILTSISRGIKNSADRMDVHQVLLWLDDIGIPQYRESMAENMIDGQMLTLLTAQDLIEMKITSALHHATIARGVQFLRSVDFHSNRLEKRFNPVSNHFRYSINRISNDLIHKGACPGEVERWSHYCTCEWLKAIDLAEFTPNLLCAGIHGALMVHEPTFTAETLAEVLQMPTHKTLLRRHLATHFNQLLGQEVISHKRAVLAQPLVVQMSPLLKIKLLKKGFLLSRKKGKNEVYVEPDEPVCPPTDSKSIYKKQVHDFSSTLKF